MTVLKGNLDTNDFYEIVYKNNSISVDNSILKKVEKCFNFLNKLSDKHIIYGVNTGFGPMAEYKIKNSEQIQLQYNLIRSHATGTGNIIKPIFVKAAMLARLNALLLGYSGVHISTIELIIKLINKNIIPVIYQHGGVGASGDLVQLAHLALVLIGEGEVFYKGKKELTKKVFKVENINPIPIKIREGIALMNGTSVMNGIGIINLINARKLLHRMVTCSSAINEIVRSSNQHFSIKLNQTKQHIGQQKIADLMCSHLKDSCLIKNGNNILNDSDKEKNYRFDEKIQECYSLRCVPQILGPILDTINNSEDVLIREVNSADDNPIIDPDIKKVYHGGNFHGDYISLEMDKLKIVITKMSMLAERQLNYLLNPKLNNVLSPFVNLGKLGLNFGMQGAQFTATSTTAENQMLSNPMYVHSIPSNNDNQDIVSMGTNASEITNKVIENAFEIVAIEMIAITQAIKYLNIEDKVSSKTKKMYDEISRIVPLSQEDITMYPYINAVIKFISNNE